MKMIFAELCVSLALLLGCTVTPSDSPAVTAEIATRLAYETMKARKQAVPAPTPSGQCQNCNGTGKLGDGRVVVTCPACKGTGKACVDGKCNVAR